MGLGLGQGRRQELGLKLELELWLRPGPWSGLGLEQWLGLWSEPGQELGAGAGEEVGTDAGVEAGPEPGAGTGRGWPPHCRQLGGVGGGCSCSCCGSSRSCCGWLSSPPAQLFCRERLRAGRLSEDLPDLPLRRHHLMLSLPRQLVTARQRVLQAVVGAAQARVGPDGAVGGAHVLWVPPAQTEVRRERSGSAGPWHGAVSGREIPALVRITTGRLISSSRV